MAYYLYVLRSEKNGQYYIGSTGSLEDRLERHNGGRSKSTKSGIPWQPVYIEEFSNRSEAVKREKKIKSCKSRTRIERLIKAE